MADKIEELIEDANSLGDEASVTFAAREFDNEGECRRFYEIVKARMFDIRQWSESSSVSSYALFDENGVDISGQPVEIGRFIRIAVYGSGKYDWVRVANIYEVPSELVITVQPSFDPTERPPKPEVVSHFFRQDSRNNFCLKRGGKTLTFYVIGINEKVNTRFTDGVLETVRNTAAANLGYYLGLQKAMWKGFCSNMLRDDE